MSPALLFGPLLVAHLAVSMARLPTHARDLRDGALVVHATTRTAPHGNAMGELVVSAPGVSQTIDIHPRAMSPQLLVGSVQLVDANFDGHPDILVLRELGAKWSASDVYLFDPRTHRFTDASPLARELGQLSNVTFDARRKQVTTHDIGPRRPSRHVYAIVGTGAGNGLRLTESCSFLNDGDEHLGTLVRTRLVGQQMHSTYSQVHLGPTDVDPCGP